MLYYLNFHNVTCHLYPAESVKLSQEAKSFPMSHRQKVQKLGLDQLYRADYRKGEDWR